MKTAQILIIGDEILSGRTQDTNSFYLAKKLSVRSIRTEKIMVLPDNLVLLSQWIYQNHSLSDYLFICGGIGGTSDDVTRKAVANALGLELSRHPKASEILKEFYQGRENPERMSMADLPLGCTLIENTVTKAPGFKIKNIYVFAGIPKILYAMFESIENELQGGLPLSEAELNLAVGEGEIAKVMKVINKEYPLVELGSYPTLDSTKNYKTQIVFKSLESELTRQAVARFVELCGVEALSKN
jgi:molybdopterin-biosynthesis enzyme MoeA-like protein